MNIRQLGCECNISCSSRSIELNSPKGRQPLQQMKWHFLNMTARSSYVEMRKIRDKTSNIAIIPNFSTIYFSQQKVQSNYSKKSSIDLPCIPIANAGWRKTGYNNVANTSGGLAINFLLCWKLCSGAMPGALLQYFLDTTETFGSSKKCHLAHKV